MNMYKYTCECGYSGDYLVPHFKDNSARCPACSNKINNVTAADIELVKLKCPYCDKENNDKGLEYYMTWKTCEYCGRNFEALKRVRYFIK